MPEIEFSVYCDKCGDRLWFGTTVKGLDVYVEPCKNCLRQARDEGFEKGMEANVIEEEE